MAVLKLRRPEDDGPSNRAGTWGELVAWFSELVISLDRGDLPGAVEAQSRIEQHGFKVTYRRTRRAAERGGR